MKNLKYNIPTIGKDIFESSNEVKDSQGSMIGMIGTKYHRLIKHIPQLNFYFQKLKNYRAQKKIRKI